jgi:Mg2+/Co2+ transporter CorB
MEGSGDLRAKSVNTLLTRQDRLIGALLIGNNLVNILGSALATSVFLTCSARPASPTRPSP